MNLEHDNAVEPVRERTTTSANRISVDWAFLSVHRRPLFAMGSLSVVPLRLAEHGYSTAPVPGRSRPREAFHPGSSGVPREPADAVRADPPARAGAGRPDRGAGSAFPW